MSIDSADEVEKLEILTTDEQRDYLEGWADKWMERGILTPFIENVAGDLNYIRFEIAANNVFYCVLYCSGISEISDDQSEAIANEIEWKMDDIENELIDVGIDNSMISDILIRIYSDD